MLQWFRVIFVAHKLVSNSIQNKAGFISILLRSLGTIWDTFFKTLSTFTLSSTSGNILYFAKGTRTQSKQNAKDQKYQLT